MFSRFFKNPAVQHGTLFTALVSGVGYVLSQEEKRLEAHRQRVEEANPGFSAVVVPVSRGPSVYAVGARSAFDYKVELVPQKPEENATSSPRVGG